MSSGGEKMSPRTGRPKSANPKGTQTTARLDADTVRKLEYCAAVLGVTKAEVLRQGVEAVYQRITTQKENP
jgi:predicted transcriptional regulator